MEIFCPTTLMVYDIHGKRTFQIRRVILCSAITILNCTVIKVDTNALRTVAYRYNVYLLRTVKRIFTHIRT